MKYAFQIGLALAGLIIFIALCLIFAPGPDVAKREMVIASRGEQIFVLDAITGVVFELKPTPGGEGLFRALGYRPDEHTDFLPVSDIDDNGNIKFYGADSSGPFELSITETESGFSWNTTGISLEDDTTLIGMNNGTTVAGTAAGISVSGISGAYDVPSPQGDYSPPVAARHPNGDWIVLWPSKTGTGKPKKGLLGAEISGYGNPGLFTVQVISPAGNVSEYKLEDESFVESRAKGLTGAVVDSTGRLILLDDKGYLSTFNGTQHASNIFAQVSPSRYAMNTIALGPDDTVLVTDAVSSMVSLIDPLNGKVLSSWRLPKPRVEVAGQGLGYWNIALDLLMVLLIIAIIMRIRARMRRYKQYRPECEG